MMKIRLLLLPIVLLGFISGVLNATSPTESIIWFVVGFAGLLGIVTLGVSSRQMIKTIRNIF